MSGDELKKRVRFEKKELEFLQQLVAKYPEVEKKEHDKHNEQLKKITWKQIMEEFNCNSDYTKRSIDQLRNAWKRIKKDWKSDQAAIRRKKFKTGGGPQSPTREPDEKDRIMETILFEQMPLGSIPDDDYLVDVNIDSTLLEGDEASTDKTSQINIDPTLPSTSSSTAKSVITKADKKSSKKVITYAEEFHRTRMAHLHEEHNLRMRVLSEELKYWEERRAAHSHPRSPRQMQPLLGEATEQSSAGEESTERATVDILKSVLFNSGIEEGL